MDTRSPASGPARSAWVARLADTAADQLNTTIAQHWDELVAVLNGDDWSRLIEVASSTPHSAEAPATAPDHTAAALSVLVAEALHIGGRTTEAAAVLAGLDLSDHPDPALAARAETTAASIAWSRGDLADCDRQLDLGEDHLGLLHGAEAEVIGARIATLRALWHAARRDRTSAAQFAELGVRRADASGDVLMQVRARLNAGLVAIYACDWLSVIQLCSSALEIGRSSGQPAVEAMLRCHLAYALARRGHLAMALEEAEAARAIHLAEDSARLALSCWTAAEIHMIRGDSLQARLEFDQALDRAESSQDGHVTYRALCGLGRLDPAGPGPAAHRHLSAALDGARTDSPVRALLSLGWRQLFDGDPAAAAQTGTALLDDAREDSAEHFADAIELLALAEAPMPAGVELATAQTIWTELGDPIRSLTHRIITARVHDAAPHERIARTQLRTLGVNDTAATIASALGVINRRPTPTVRIRIQALGPFSIWRDGEPIATSQWPAAKARELLKLLAASGESGVERNLASDALWAEGASASRLSVAVSQLRTVLDPAKEHASDWYVSSRDGRLVLRHADVDVHDFKIAARSALSAASDDAATPPLLDLAVQLWTGDLLVDDDHHWITPLRSDLDRTAREVVRRCADTHAAGEHPERAIAAWERLIGHDPYDEDGHLQLLRSLLQVGRHGRARASYDRYAQMMAELDLEPQPWAQLMREATSRG